MQKFLVLSLLSLSLPVFAQTPPSTIDVESSHKAMPSDVHKWGFQPFTPDVPDSCPTRDFYKTCHSTLVSDFDSQLGDVPANGHMDATATAHWLTNSFLGAYTMTPDWALGLPWSTKRSPSELAVTYDGTAD